MKWLVKQDSGLQGIGSKVNPNCERIGIEHGRCSLSRFSTVRSESECELVSKRKVRLSRVTHDGSRNVFDTIGKMPSVANKLPRNTRTARSVCSGKPCSRAGSNLDPAAGPRDNITHEFFRPRHHVSLVSRPLPLIRFFSPLNISTL